LEEKLELDHGTSCSSQATSIQSDIGAKVNRFARWVKNSLKRSSAAFMDSNTDSIDSKHVSRRGSTCDIAHSKPREIESSMKVSTTITVGSSSDSNGSLDDSNGDLTRSSELFLSSADENL
ncbi:unnamed protein product, partial [Thelazia callipaeda]|uniref:Pecanex-like protein n=1 Tax=Thelazia callipaeda TaxID=103827 RepID=A0A0N5CXX3_THECL